MKASTFIRRHLFAALFLFLSAALFAQTGAADSASSPENDAETSAPDTEAPVNMSGLPPPEKSAPPPNTLEAARLETINYGTETEIAALIQTLKSEGSDYLDTELIALAANTHNQNILAVLFAFFAEREKGGLEERAIRAIEERDIETNETVLAATEYLGRVKAAPAAPVLRELLDSRERRFMNAAFRALGRAGGGEEGDDTALYLIDFYTNGDPGDENRREIITALGAAKSVKGVSFLAEIAESAEERAPLRIAALDSLAKIGDAGGLKAILGCVSTGDPNVRSSAVAALGPFSGSEVDKAILEAFRDSFYRTRLAAARASRERRFEAALPYLKFRAERDEVPQVKDEAIRALGAIAGEEANGIIESLFVERKNGDRVRLVAAEMLMKNEPAKHLDRLVLELDEAKLKSQTPLYNGLLKILGESRSENLETITRRLLKDGGVLEKSYALDMAVNNNLADLEDEIRAITEGKSESLARKARRTLEKLGLE